MGKTYILDGYNVIGKIPKLREIKIAKSPAHARTALGMMLADISHYRYGKEFIIVFDGKAGEVPYNSKTYIHGIPCYFTRKDEEADDYIGVMLSRIKNTTDVVVISDDGKVANKCKVYRTEFKHPTFLEQNNTKKVKSKDESKELSSSDEREITDWYRNKLKGN